MVVQWDIGVLLRPRRWRGWVNVSAGWYKETSLAPRAVFRHGVHVDAGNAGYPDGVGTSTLSVAGTAQSSWSDPPENRRQKRAVLSLGGWRTSQMSGILLITESAKPVFLDRSEGTHRDDQQ